MQKLFSTLCVALHFFLLFFYFTSKEFYYSDPVYATVGDQMIGKKLFL